MWKIRFFRPSTEMALGTRRFCRHENRLELSQVPINPTESGYPFSHQSVKTWSTESRPVRPMASEFDWTLSHLL
jgi:hypothetical protein